jgi:hypothetical protein
MHKRRIPRELWLPAAGLVILLAAIWLIAGRSSPEVSQDHFARYRPPAMLHLKLTLSRSNLWRLRLKREQALRRGVLISSDGDQVNATLYEGTSSWPVTIRLKGDWTDHLRGGKWSFRVRMRRDTAFRGMSAFSLQNPETRDFISEWLFHQVLRQEDVLSPRYDFVQLSVNGSELGVYALEEHFTKELLESQGRREGPLLKFSEDGMWEARVEALRDTLFPYLVLPIYEAAQPEAFQTSRHLKLTPTGSDSSQIILQTALNLLYQYKHGLAPARHLFDLDQVARQYALTDVFQGHHSLVWHNRRFAYNPVTIRLEPVVYDAFAGKNSGLYLNGPFTGYACNGNTSYGRREDLLGTCFFAEESFVKAYYRYLQIWSRPQFISSIKRKYEAEWKKRENFLRREFLGYSFDWGEIVNHAAVIRDALKEISYDQIKVEIQPGNQQGIGSVCVQNYALLAVEARIMNRIDINDQDKWRLIGAYDGVAGAEWLEFPLLDEMWLEVRVAQSEGAHFTYPLKLDSAFRPLR